ncbi:hypothetical protein T492DRAFT_895497 [Pavlovales sp. CCMP2436]|nr:hypothetical protein T492DRAFT_895497 [Pavlovales sp. CCMP2436]
MLRLASECEFKKHALSLLPPAAALLVKAAGADPWAEVQLLRVKAATPQLQWAQWDAHEEGAAAEAGAGARRQSFISQARTK